MESRRDVLKPFEAKNDYMEDRIASGIEANRKGYAYLKLVDAEGKPVENAHLRIRQKSHEFKYGANLFMLGEFPEEEQNRKYEAYYAQAFNMATLPFYWNTLEPEQGKPRFAKDSPKIYRRPAPDLCLEYCEANDIKPKAHCLNYNGFIPEWAIGSIAHEKACLDKRFRELAERYSRRIPDWEVTNETFVGGRMSQPQKYGNFYSEDDFIEWSFAEAERYFSGNQLIINEDKPHTFGAFLKSRSLYYMQIERALMKGARIDKIGMQFHMFHRAEQELEAARKYYDPELIYDVLDTYGRFNKPIQITESTIPAYSGNAVDEELQMEIIYNLYRMWFSHPATEAIIYWNLVDGFAHGAVPGDMTYGENYYYGGLIRYDFTPKPAFEMICDLFQKQYHTELELDTVNGEASFKGFYGDYDIEIKTDSGIATRSLSLLKKLGNKFEIKL